MIPKVKGDCPLLSKYFIPTFITCYGRSKGSRSDFANMICNEKCPPSLCIYERAGNMTRFEKEILLAVTIPCPKCSAVDVWQDKGEDGTECRHCGKIIYHFKPVAMREMIDE